MSPCQSCGKPTNGSTGAAGIFTPVICQVCRDKADQACLQSVQTMSKMFDTLFSHFTTQPPKGTRP